MNEYLVAAGALLLLITLNHSLAGEKYIVMPVLRLDNLPGLFGAIGPGITIPQQSFMRRVLRMAWHVTVLPWVGSAAIFFYFARQPVTEDGRTVLFMTSAVYLATAVVIMLTTRGRHISWLVFLTVALCGWYGAQS